MSFHSCTCSMCTSQPRTLPTHCTTAKSCPQEQTLQTGDKACISGKGGWFWTKRGCRRSRQRGHASPSLSPHLTCTTIPPMASSQLPPTQLSQRVMEEPHREKLCLETSSYLKCYKYSGQGPGDMTCGLGLSFKTFHNLTWCSVATQYNLLNK